MSIGTNIDRMHPQLKETALAKGWWDNSKPFHWSNVIIGDNVRDDIGLAVKRFECGKRMLQEHQESSKLLLYHN